MSFSIGELIRQGKQELSKYNIPEIEARLIAEHVFMDNFTGIVNRYQEIVDEETVKVYKDIIAKRTTYYPLQYITGHQTFYGIDFHVNEHVLIPRPETEMLVDLGIDFVKTISEEADKKNVANIEDETTKLDDTMISAEAIKLNESKTIGNSVGNSRYRDLFILDMCTGSGCIAISLASELDKLNYKGEISVLGVDVSHKALEVARKNMDMVNLNRVSLRFLESDLFERLEGMNFDLILSNPPYISPSDIEGLMPDVKDFEPHLALDGGPDGLDFYRKITESGAKHLNPGGGLFFEIGHGQMKEVEQLLYKQNFKGVDTMKDLGQFERIVYGIKLNKPD